MSTPISQKKFHELAFETPKHDVGSYKTCGGINWNTTTWFWGVIKGPQAFSFGKAYSAFKPKELVKKFSCDCCKGLTAMDWYCVASVCFYRKDPNYNFHTLNYISKGLKQDPQNKCLLQLKKKIERQMSGNEQNKQADPVQVKRSKVFSEIKKERPPLKEKVLAPLQGNSFARFFVQASEFYNFADNLEGTKKIKPLIFAKNYIETHLKMVLNEEETTDLWRLQLSIYYDLYKLSENEWRLPLGKIITDALQLKIETSVVFCLGARLFFSESIRNENLSKKNLEKAFLLIMRAEKICKTETDLEKEENMKMIFSLKNSILKEYRGLTRG